MKEKLKSRKFLIAVVSSLIILICDITNIKLDDTTVRTLAGIVVAYILGQGIIDYQEKKQKANGVEIVEDAIRKLVERNFRSQQKKKGENGK